MSIRLKQKQDERKLAESEGLIIDKKINEYCSEIRQSRTRLQDYVSNISCHVSQIISHRLNKFVALHSQIVEEKDHEIKSLEEYNEQARLSQMGENIRKLMKRISDYELEIERLTTIKEMFRKESERFKIQLDIKEKELDASKKREKQLMKKIWVLEEDIKDIYSAEAPQRKGQGRTKIQNFCTPKKVVRNNTEAKTKGMHQTNHVISTEPTKIEDRDRLQSQLEEKYSGSRINALKAASKFRQKFSISSQEKRIYTGMKSASPSVNASYTKQSVVRPLNATATAKDLNLYGDLRMNLRKASRMRETEPQFWNEKEKSLLVEDFRAICLHGPKVMQQIESVFIDNYGELKEIDEASIDLLTELFKCENAIKILQIVLFNYSLDAIGHIQDHKKELITEMVYNAPALETSEIAAGREGKPKRIKMEKQLRKKFKNSIIRKNYDDYSHREEQE